MNHVKINFDAYVRRTGLVSIAWVARDCFGAILPFNFHSIGFNNIVVAEAWVALERLFKACWSYCLKISLSKETLPSPSHASIQSASIHSPCLASLKTFKRYVEAVGRGSGSGSGSLMSIERQTLWRIFLENLGHSCSPDSTSTQDERNREN
uniref:Uncharacterized protein n=1 Tax=Nelumbo nucifera TaxID=4432 RepID=A0A822ZTW7_NELNU|nr:TPA_asm: hypothetical protein HUJ06_017937 [Nelumbo nucifera]